MKHPRVLVRRLASRERRPCVGPQHCHTHREHRHSSGAEAHWGAPWPDTRSLASVATPQPAFDSLLHRSPPVGAHTATVPEQLALIVHHPVKRHHCGPTRETVAKTSWGACRERHRRQQSASDLSIGRSTWWSSEVLRALRFQFAQTCHSQIADDKVIEQAWRQ